MTTTTSEPEVLTGYAVHVQTTWQSRLVKALAEKYGCDVTMRRKPRVIGGRQTAKFDREAVLNGNPKKVALAAGTFEHLMLELNAGSNAYAKSLPTDLSPTRRKIERRAWLEKRATEKAEKLLNGG